MTPLVHFVDGVHTIENKCTDGLIGGAVLDLDVCQIVENLLQFKCLFGHMSARSSRTMNLRMASRASTAPTESMV